MDQRCIPERERRQPIEMRTGGSQRDFIDDSLEHPIERLPAEVNPGPIVGQECCLGNVWRDNLLVGNGNFQSSCKLVPERGQRHNLGAGLSERKHAFQNAEQEHQIGSIYSGEIVFFNPFEEFGADFRRSHAARHQQVSRILEITGRTIELRRVAGSKGIAEASRLE